MRVCGCYKIYAQFFIVKKKPEKKKREIFGTGVVQVFRDMSKAKV